MLRNERGWFMQSHELMPVLGFNRGGHLPEEGFAPREVQGVIFMCVPASFNVTQDGRRRKGSKHRIKYLCEDCQHWVPFGRAAQHRQGRVHKENAMLRSWVDMEKDLEVLPAEDLL